MEIVIPFSGSSKGIERDRRRRDKRDAVDAAIGLLAAINGIVPESTRPLEGAPPPSQVRIVAEHERPPTATHFAFERAFIQIARPNGLSAIVLSNAVTIVQDATGRPWHVSFRFVAPISSKPTIMRLCRESATETATLLVFTEHPDRDPSRPPVVRFDDCITTVVQPIFEISETMICERIMFICRTGHARTSS